MPQPPFVLIAQAPASLAQQVIERLNASFGVTVSAEHLLAGAAVLQAPTKGELEGRVADVLAAGASCRIVDATGAIVVDVSSPSPPDNRTLIGMQPGVQPDSTPGGPPALLGPPAVDAPPPAVAPPPPTPAAPSAPPPTPPSAPTAAPSLDNLDRLDDAALVALDGSVDPSPSPAVFDSPDAPPQPDNHFESQVDHRFDPDAGQDSPLELDVSPMAMPPPNLAPIMAPEEMEEPAPRASRRAAPQARFKALPRWVLLDGLLRRQWPRLRIIVGFILALAFGSIWPACHANSVITRHIEPARQELSRAKAYGHLLADQRSFRSSEQIDSYIGSLKRRHAGYGVIMWMVCGGAVGFAWFRFT